MQQPRSYPRVLPYIHDAFTQSNLFELELKIEETSPT